MARKGREEKKDTGDTSSSSQRSTRSKSRAESEAASQPAEVSELFHPMTSNRFNFYTVHHPKRIFWPLIRLLFVYLDVIRSIRC